MPIRFRCGYCNKLLGIARRKAGSETTCPHCGYTLTVPDDPAGDISEMEDLDELLNPVSSPPPPTAHASVSERNAPATYSPSPVGGPSTARATKPSPTPSVPASTTTADPRSSNERPLFERHLDDVLGAHQPLNDTSTAKPKTSPISGMDSLSLGEERGQIVLSVQKATLLAIVVVLLIGLSFAAGYLLASTK